VGKLVAPDS